MHELGLKVFAAVWQPEVDDGQLEVCYKHFEVCTFGSELQEVDCVCLQLHWTNTEPQHCRITIGVTDSFNQVNSVGIGNCQRARTTHTHK